MENTSDLRFAILIDADNISEKYVKIILEEVANSGVATYKRIYGDWTSSRLTSWKNCLLENSIIPMQQYSYTVGKNATDSAMIIDAMDILYSDTVDGFAIASSDSDFTRLAARLRESGKVVIGLGEQKTPRPFISACNTFKYLDILYAARIAEEEAEEEVETSDRDVEKSERAGKASRKGDRAEKSKRAVSASEKAKDDGDSEVQRRRRPGDMGQGVPEVGAEQPDISFGEMDKADRRRHMKKIREAINAILDKFSDDEGWMNLGQLGEQLAKRLPDFDVRNYGYKKLCPFLKSLGAYEFDEPSGKTGQRPIYMRRARQAPRKSK
ncbi:MAG: NYN domain-containing protein [Coriobacteriaceae bacterium]|nr:NYN domain-containing protein [Coriobacteriaceae bacterium]